MEEAPLPIIVDIQEKQIIEEKDYIINNSKDQYRLIIKRDLGHIYFKLYKLGEIALFRYKNKFDLKNIIDILKINQFLYNDFDKIFKLIDECYSNNKIFLNINNTNIDLIIKLNDNSKEYEVTIHLYKSQLNMNEQFEDIINEIKDIKKDPNNLLDDRIFGIQLLLNDIKNDANIKISEDKKEIDSLGKKSLNNVNEIKKTYDEIEQLKKRISKIKKEKENYGISSINNKK